MLKTLTKKLRRHSLNEIHPFQLKISYHGSGEGGESDDSEGENQELAQIDRERRRNCALTPLATSQQHNQGPISPARLRRLRLLLDANLDRHSSEEELERISCGDNRKWMAALPQWHSDHHSSASSDEEVRDLCGCGTPAASARPLVEPGTCLAASPSPVHFSSSPPRSLKPPPMRFQLQVVQPVARPMILSHFDQSAPYRKYRHSYSGEPGRPSLDLEKMQQKMLLKKNCGGKTRSIKIRIPNTQTRPGCPLHSDKVARLQCPVNSPACLVASTFMSIQLHTETASGNCVCSHALCKQPSCAGDV